MQTLAPRCDPQTFLNLPLVTDLSQLEAGFAILGIPHGMPYSTQAGMDDQANAPAAIRVESARLSLGLDRWDFDLGGLLFPEGEILAVDCGDVPGDLSDPLDHYRQAERAVREIVGHQAIPIILGGDHGVPIPVLRALDGQGSLTVVQVDAHLDWRDEVNGVREGYSSPMRRAAELAHIEGIVQIGIRAQGSARAQDLRDALAYGAKIITAYEVHEQGMQAVLEQIPADGRYYLTVDADGLDPAVMPAVAGPAAGGLLFHQVRKLIHGLAARGELIGMDIVEITPSRDVNGISAITAGQLILNFIGAASRPG